MRRDIATPHPTDAEWLILGWKLTIQIATILGHFTQYQNITTVDARRDFLQERTNVLQAVAFIDCSPYWQGIGKELAELWAKRLEEEILTRAGPTYGYAVPLYRRWVAWRWPPETIRQESLV